MTECKLDHFEGEKILSTGRKCSWRWQSYRKEDKRDATGTVNTRDKGKKIPQE